MKPNFATAFANLALPRLGAKVLFATDDFFAAKERLIDPHDPQFIADKYDDNGKWMDGWESRRKRVPGHDHCIIQLGQRGSVEGFDIDTAHFNGNQPVEASIDMTVLEEGAPGDDTLWTECLPKIPLQANAQHFIENLNKGPCTHLRLNIFPDGGVARLRAYGTFLPDWSRIGKDKPIDLAAITHGGRPIACNDEHFGTLANLISPPPALDMGDGWETRRRREPGYDWAVIKLGHTATLTSIEIDTAHFKGNYPDRFSLQAALAPRVTDKNIDEISQDWPLILNEQKLTPDDKASFTLEGAGPVSHVRLNIFPDGGVARLHVLGRPFFES